MNKINIIDATLREGKQSLRRELSTKDILTISEKIISLGVDQLEVGHAAISTDEILMLRQLKKTFPNTSILTHARATIHDVEKAIEANVDWIGIFISVNTYATFRINNFSFEKIIERTIQSVELAKANNLKVRFTIEDSSRTNSELMLKVYETAINLGADRICLADTLGVLEPKETGQVIQMLREKHQDIPLEVHFHNDRGLAMANTLQAIESGAQWISSSINGIGERAGITDTCLLLANLHYKQIRLIPGGVNLKEASDLVSRTTRLFVDEHRPVIGKKAFFHVADLHVKAMKKNLASYNWVEPELFGQKTKCINKLPALQLSDLILRLQAKSTNLSSEPFQQHFSLEHKVQMPDANLHYLVKKIPFVSVAQTTFEHFKSCKGDSNAIFIGQADDLEGLQCEIALDNERFMVRSPVCVFIPSCVQFAFRIISGEGLYLHHILNADHDEDQHENLQNVNGSPVEEELI